jgi:catechol 2,3-dioxygenase-like lactoylglutathione lyase family enzyme
MKYEGVCIAVSDIKLARKFYEELFGFEVFQDYGINISFYGGLSLQQEFDWLLGVAKEKVLKESHNMELYFEEDNFNDFLEKLNQYPDIKYMGDGVKEQSWGQRTVRFYDLDGHIIEVGENMKMVVKHFLESGMTIEETSKRMNVTVNDLEKLLE